MPRCVVVGWHEIHQESMKVKKSGSYFVDMYIKNIRDCPVNISQLQFHPGPLVAVGKVGIDSTS